MKPAAFDYSRPATLDEACALLAAGGDDVRIIAGGQTLVPLMAMRLARPKRLIDIARLEELAYVREEGDAVEIGATTRQCVLERDPVVAARLPLLAQALPLVGHAPIRARGTIGGSLANADPAAEIALVAVTLGALLRYRDGAGSREIAAADFFVGPMMTALPPAGCLTAVRFPVWREPRIGSRLPRDQRPPQRLRVRGRGRAGGARRGRHLPPCRRRHRRGHRRSAAARRGRRGARRHAHRGGRGTRRGRRGAGGIEPMSDLHASAGYRRRAASILAVRAITDAARAAGAGHAR